MKAELLTKTRGPHTIRQTNVDDTTGEDTLPGSFLLGGIYITYL